MEQKIQLPKGKADLTCSDMRVIFDVVCSFIESTPEKWRCKNLFLKMGKVEAVKKLFERFDVAEFESVTPHDAVTFLQICFLKMNKKMCFSSELYDSYVVHTRTRMGIDVWCSKEFQEHFKSVQLGFLVEFKERVLKNMYGANLIWNPRSVSLYWQPLLVGGDSDNHKNLMEFLLFFCDVDASVCSESADSAEREPEKHNDSKCICM